MAALATAFRALVGFYDENPRDLDLSLYLLNGARPRGLTPALNRELNGKLLAVLDVYRLQLPRPASRTRASAWRSVVSSTR